MNSFRNLVLVFGLGVQIHEGFERCVESLLAVDIAGHSKHDLLSIFSVVIAFFVLNSLL